MTRIRIQFILFALGLAVIWAAGLNFTHERLDAEARILWERTAENAFNQMQAAISERLTKEDKRSFSEYRYLFIPEGQTPLTKNLIVSPLSALPDENDDGLIGYFQIDPDGSFHTPYLPPRGKTLPDNDKRKKLQDYLRHLTQSFQKNARDDYRSRMEEEKRSGDLKTDSDSGADKSAKTVELGALQDESDVADQKIYPNPLKAKAEQKKKSKSTSGIVSKGGSSTKKKDEGYSREIKNDPVQSRAFEEQNVANNDDVVGAPTPAQNSAPSQAEEDPSSIFIDPFRARLVGDDTLIFYRKIWLGQRLYLQGFAVDLAEYFWAPIADSFDASELGSFAHAELTLGDKALIHSAPTSGGITFFARNLGYPLNLFSLKVLADRFPASAAKTSVDRFALIAGLLMMGALYFIYRGVSTQVFLSRKRQDFVSAVTHELKTPLTAIRMYGEMLEQDWVKDEAKRVEYFQNINREGARLSRLIENVLHLSSLEKGTFRMHPVVSDARADFMQIAAELKPLAERASINFVAEVKGEVGKALYDVEAIKQIFFTLLDNSLKFARDAKMRQIEMTLAREGRSLIWSLADHGPGVPASELSRIFDTFYRVESEMTRKTKGSGIGLAMARMMAQAMGAKIEAQNRSGGGLAVRVILDVLADVALPDNKSG